MHGKMLNYAKNKKPKTQMCLGMLEGFNEKVSCGLLNESNIFLPGPYSLNGYRVRVYRQDSATQWFTGIITHHDLFSRNMVVMNDQVHSPTCIKKKIKSLRGI